MAGGDATAEVCKEFQYVLKTRSTATFCCGAVVFCDTILKRKKSSNYLELRPRSRFWTGKASLVWRFLTVA